MGRDREALEVVLVEVVPGRETRIDVDITETGTYAGVCAEFCGLLHDEMTFELEAVTPQEFDVWVDGLEVSGGG